MSEDTAKDNAPLDLGTQAAIRQMLRGQGRQRSGMYIVTVYGGRIVAVAEVGPKIVTDPNARPSRKRGARENS